jgi:serine/threonine-protein kinase 24/25/MST4
MESKQVKWKHVCQVFDCFGEDGKVFIVMEFFAGGSIKDLLELI